MTTDPRKPRFTASFSSHEYVETPLRATTLDGAKREATKWSDDRGTGTLRVYMTDRPDPVALRTVHIYADSPWVTP